MDTGGGGVGPGNTSSSSQDSGLSGGGNSEMEGGKVIGGSLRRFEDRDGVGVVGVEEKGGTYVVLDVMLEEEEEDLKGSKKGELREFQCRICHLESDLERPDGSELILLGCDCKGELGTSHRHCAEAWFKLKGNRYCEICGILAKNITGTEDESFFEEWNANRMPSNSNSGPERGFWRRQPFCKILIACVVVAFVLPWFLKVNVI